MRLELKRVFLGSEYTIGKLYIDGVYFCDTLEDTYRELPKETKVPGKTAIPPGIYVVTLEVQSPRFKDSQAYKFCNGYLPRLLNVPYFEGILIHIGNYPKDTDGCILVGENKQKGAVLNSTETFKKLYTTLEKSVGRITITIS